MNIVSVAVLATCFNRRAITLRGLEALRSAASGIDYRVYLVDDGCTDGTGEAIAADFPEVQLIRGTGSLYWNGGMRAAWQAAMPDRPAYFLWWNDDLDLLPDSIVRLLEFQSACEAEHGRKVISVGKVVDPVSGAVTYGGYAAAPGWSKLRFVRTTDERRPCETMNGNCVLLPARVVDDIGILAEQFSHAIGDVDYGLRARKAGYLLFQTPFVVGETPRNEAYAANTARLTWSNRHFILRHPKGIPIREWLHFCRSHGGWLWPANFVVRYVRILRLGARS